MGPRGLRACTILSDLDVAPGAPHLRSIMSLFLTVSSTKAGALPWPSVSLGHFTMTETETTVAHGLVGVFLDLRLVCTSESTWKWVNFRILVIY